MFAQGPPSECADVAPEHMHLAGIDFRQPGYAAENRGLAGAARTEQGHDLARPNGEVDIGQARAVP